jgi:hypothetical protein
MGFMSQAGHVGVKTQAVKGTYLSPGAVAPNQGVFIFFRSGALGGNRELLIPDPEIGGSRDIPDAQLGPISYSGEYDFYARMESLATWMKGALGTSIVSGTAPTGFLHTITPAATTIPWLSVEEKIADGYEAFRYTDAKVNTLHLEADANGYLMGTVGLIALEQELEASPTIIANQRLDSSPLLVGTNVCVRWGGVDLPAKSFSLDINNNLEDDDYRLCGFFLGDLVEKRREITASVTIRPQDSALWRTAMWGSPVATAPLGQSFKDDVEIEVETYEDIPGATAGIKYNMTITIPQAAIAPFSLDPSGDDVIEHDIEIRALRPSLATPVATVTILNSYPTIA